jgi:hypothetical protein
MFMARASERLSADAFTRASVEAYLRAVAEERTRLELATAEQRSRLEAAEEILERLDAIALPAGWTQPVEPSTTPVASGE